MTKIPSDAVKVGFAAMDKVGRIGEFVKIVGTETRAIAEIVTPFQAALAQRPHPHVKSLLKPAFGRARAVLFADMALGYIDRLDWQSADVKGTFINGGDGVSDLLRPAKPLAAFVRLLKMRVEPGLKVIAAFKLRDDLKSERRPIVECLATVVRRDAATDLDRSVHADGLDEVDAPLDDANVGKFTQMIQKFSENSQFIIVTHNKMTMSAVDVIYGVTMQEPGGSKLEPVDFRKLN